MYVDTNVIMYLYGIFMERLKHDQLMWIVLINAFINPLNIWKMNSVIDDDVIIGWWQCDYFNYCSNQIIECAFIDDGYQCVEENCLYKLEKCFYDQQTQ